MRPAIRICLVLVAAVTGFASAQDQVIAFTNVNVVPMDRDRVLANQTVIVRNGTIAELGPAARITVPANAQRVDGTGKYLMPGLAEMHGHLTVPGNVYAPENVLFLYVAAGVTTVRGMQGNPAHLDLRKKVMSGELIGPHLYLSSPPLSGNNVPDVATAVQKVREAKAAGFDHLKVHEGLTREVYDAIARTAREVGLEWGGHISQFVGVRHALAAKQSTIDHLDDYIEAIDSSEANIPKIAQETRAAGVAVVPTMPLWEVIRGLHTPESMNDRPELRYAPPQTRAQWVNQARGAQANFPPAVREREIAFRNKILKGLSDGGVLILLGSDAPQAYSVPGFSIQREMETMVKAGMTPFQVLQSGTVNVAKFYDAEKTTGTVAVGKRADLILLDANPLQDIRNVANKSGVMIHGKWHDRASIQKRLDQIAEAYRQ